MTYKQKLLSIILMSMGAGLGLWTLFFAEVESRLPTFSTTTVFKSALSHEDLKGKVTLVNFWATSCVSCVKEMPVMKKIYQAYKPQAFELVALAMPYDENELVTTFALKNELPFPVVYSSNSDLVTSFGRILVTPTLMLFDKQGRKQYQWIGAVDEALLKAAIDKLLKQS